MSKRISSQRLWMIPYSGCKGVLCEDFCFGDSRSPSSSSKLSLVKSWRVSKRVLEFTTFSDDDGGVKKQDAEEASKIGVERPNLWSPGDSGDRKQLGMSYALPFFFSSRFASSIGFYFSARSLFKSPLKQRRASTFFNSTAYIQTSEASLSISQSQGDFRIPTNHKKDLSFPLYSY